MPDATLGNLICVEGVQMVATNVKCGCLDVAVTTACMLSYVVRDPLICMPVVSLALLCV